jgi:hypothetical protein
VLLNSKLIWFLYKLHLRPLTAQHLDIVQALEESHSFPEALFPFNSKVNANKWIYDRYRRVILLDEAGDLVLLSLFIREATFLNLNRWDNLLLSFLIFRLLVIVRCEKILLIDG